MSLSSTAWLFALGLAGAGILLGHEQHKTAQLKSELHQRRAASERIQELDAQKGRLLALQVSEEELAQLRRDHEETAELRQALRKLGRKSIADELTRRAAATARMAAPEVAVQVQAEPESLVPTPGSFTPRSTLESVIMAASAGSVETLTPLIAFEAGGRAKALEIFQRLPADVQTSYGSPERIYATLLAASLPLGITHTFTLQERVIGDQQKAVAVRLYRRDGSSHEAEFQFSRTGTKWQLIMPRHVVEKYGRMLIDP